MIFNNFFKRHWRIILIEIILLILTIVALVGLFSRSNTIHIAVVGDQGKEFEFKIVKDALEIYAKRINKYGGIVSEHSRIDGKRLEFVFYDDKGSPEEAQKIARKFNG
ncbi:MAG: ABC transporter substrate-binding protein, partial [Candidatus Electrothrix sp. ATG2]|nr:ABC transporter substrate-binding protein [Candidatus Electrothrix sp. ATG2]